MLQMGFKQMFKFVCLLLCGACFSNAIRSPLVAPYVDVTRMGNNYLEQVYHKTGLKAVTLAFVLGGIGGCEPSWGGEGGLQDAKILNEIKNFQNLGGKVIIATGGAMGPYLETACSSPSQLANAYKKTLNTVGTNHLDIDIEATVSLDNMNAALSQLQNEIPGLTISFTLMVQGDDYGLTDALGVNVLRNAAKHNVNVDIVNAMTMEFGTKHASWGDAVIDAAESTIKQMQQVWPQKSQQELYSMLGVTPMIGRNYNGKVFNLDHAKQLVAWAKSKKVGHLAFWSLGRDTGKCPNGGISPDCSSIAQNDLDFTKIFQEYAGTKIPDVTPRPHTTITADPHHPKTTKNPHPPKMDCSSEAYYPHETDCDKYYWCYGGVPHLEHCGAGTVWDPKINSCNFKESAQRTDCV